MSKGRELTMADAEQDLCCMIDFAALDIKAQSYISVDSYKLQASTSVLSKFCMHYTQDMDMKNKKENSY